MMNMSKHYYSVFFFTRTELTETYFWLFFAFCRSRIIPSIEVKGMSFSQSVEAPLTLKDTAFMSGKFDSTDISTKNAIIKCN